MKIPDRKAKEDHLEELEEQYQEDTKKIQDHLKELIEDEKSK